MIDKNEGQSTASSSGNNTDSKNNATKTPEQLTQIAEDQRKRAERAETEARSAKEMAEKTQAEIAELRKTLEDNAGKSGEVSNDDINKIAEEFDVDPKFATALANAISSKSEKAVAKAREDLQKEISKRDQELKVREFEDAFDKALTNATDGIDVTVDREAVKTVFLDRVKANQDLTVAEVVAQMYGGASGRSSSEDDARGGAEGSGTAIDFDTARKDPKKLSAILADPTAKSKYYAWRDSKGL